jgi:hypothetical protein
MDWMQYSEMTSLSVTVTELSQKQPSQTQLHSL